MSSTFCVQTVVSPVVNRRFVFVEKRIRSTTSKMIVNQMSTTITSIVLLDAVAITLECPSVHEFEQLFEQIARMDAHVRITSVTGTMRIRQHQLQRQQLKSLGLSPPPVI